METKIEKIVEKLKKLKRAYEGAKAINSEGEANAAAAAIQRILLEYNLSMDDVDTKEEDKSKVTEEHVSGYNYKSIGGKWEFKLAQVICKWNFCYCFMQGNHQRIVIVGKPENIETVKWLLTLLSERFVAISKVRYKEYQLTWEYREKPIVLDTYQRRYLVGCAAGLGIKFQEESNLMKQQEAEYKQKVDALVLRNDREIKMYVDSKYKMKFVNMNTKIDSCFHKGLSDGRNTVLNKQIENTRRAPVDNVKFLK